MRSMILFVLLSVFPSKVNRILAIVLTVLVVLYFEIQFVYNSIFGEFMQEVSGSIPLISTKNNKPQGQNLVALVLPIRPDT